VSRGGEIYGAKIMDFGLLWKTDVKMEIKLSSDWRAPAMGRGDVQNEFFDIGNNKNWL
jgi:hypothetical protein